jgi:DNA primase
MQDAKEEVRARLNIEDVVGEYVQLKRAGRNFKGLSPFSGEKTPSFFVSPDKHIWHDFSSNKGGDVFSFVMEVEGMDFRQALEHLARKAGVDLSLYESKGNQDLARRKKRLLEAHELAANYYQHSLLKNQHALEYVFKKRGLSKQIVQDFKIGYAPTAGDALVQFLSKKGFSRSELNDAGLTNRFGGDMFRGRMTVPLMDGAGQVIGFTARIIADDPNAPKYLNTPQTILYDKGRHVFGLSQAKEAIRTNDYAVIVEGNLDVVSSHQAGILGVVATAGTAMTENHLRALRRLTGNVRLAFDGDKAGIAATERAIPIASEVGVELTIITLPEGFKDPDELIQKDPALWQKAIDTAEPAVDWILMQYGKREDITTASGKRAFTTAALQVVRGLNDAVERDHYEQKIAAITGSSLEAIKTKLQSVKREEAQPQKQVQKPASYKIPAPVKRDKNVESLLSVACRDIHVQDLFRGVDPMIFAIDDQRAVATYIVKHLGKPLDGIPPELQEHEKYVTMLLLNPDVDTLYWNEQSRIDSAAQVLRMLTKNHKIQQLEKQIEEADAIGDDDKATKLREQLIKERNNA